MRERSKTLGKRLREKFSEGERAFRGEPLGCSDLASSLAGNVGLSFSARSVVARCRPWALMVARIAVYAPTGVTDVAVGTSPLDPGSNVEKVVNITSGV